MFPYAHKFQQKKAHINANFYSNVYIFQNNLIFRNAHESFSI